MVGLLDLPIELRLNILDLVIHAERHRPQEYTKDGSRAQMNEIKQMRGSHGAKSVYCETDREAYRSTASKIRLINRQFKQEVESLTRTMSVTYKLDLAIMQGRQLWPTWTSIPVYRSTIDVIKAKIHVAGSGKPCTRVLRGGDAGPPFLFWMLYCMLEHYFLIGIVPAEIRSPGAGVTSDRKQIMAVRTLDLDFVEPPAFQKDTEKHSTSDKTDDDPSEEDEPNARCGYCKRFCHRGRRFKSDTFEPESLYCQVVSQFFALLRSYLRHLGDIIFRGVETVRFRLRGDLRYEFVIAELLQNWPKTNGDSEEGLWINETIAIRKSFGLKTFEMAEPRETIFDDRWVWTMEGDAIDAVRPDHFEGWD